MHRMWAQVYPRRTRFGRKTGEWDWRIVASNGGKVGTSGGQGFTERNDAKEAVVGMVTALGGMIHVEYVDD